MNDFTREELKNLHYYTHIYHHITEIILPESFLDKIQSMIDNYCEHEWENNCCPCEIGNTICKKCEISLEDLTNDN